MNPNTDLIAQRIAALPIANAERQEALSYVAAGEGFADLLIAIAQFFQIPQALTHSH